MLKFWRRIRYSSKSSGPSKVSRKTSSASGGMYRSVGIRNSGSPYRRASATPSIGGAPSGALRKALWRSSTPALCATAASRAVTTPGSGSGAAPWAAPSPLEGASELT